MADSNRNAEHKLRSYSRLELVDAIEDGARCVTFKYCWSFVEHGIYESEIFVVQDRSGAIRAGFWYTLGTAVLGWWGSGLLVSPFVILSNLRGGTNKTDEILRTLKSAAMSKTIVSSDFEEFEGPPDDQTPAEFLGTFEGE